MAFSIGSENCKVGGFEFLAPTACRNALRVLRAMQLPKPGMLLILVLPGHVFFGLKALLHIYFRA